MFKPLSPDQCTKIITSTISDRLPISIALEFNKIEISRFFFLLSKSQNPRERSDSWNKGIHPLINALKANCFQMIFLISRNLWDINDNIRGYYTPLVCAVKNSDIRYVRLILLLGADVNKPCMSGISPLIASVFNSRICSFLLSKNPNLNHQDDDGNTALHIAAAKAQRQSAQLLINADADVLIRNNERMMPLMVASVNLNYQIVMDLCEHDKYSQIEKIEALEVLSACSVGFPSTNINSWFRALEMRNPRFPKIKDVPTQKILDFSREFTTKKELKHLLADQLKLAFQGILVIERILGRNNFVYLRLLLQTTLIAENKNKLEKFQQLMDYIVKHCQETPAHIIRNCLYYFKIIFTKIFSNANPGNIFENGTFDLFKIIARASVVIWQSVKDKFYETPTFLYIYYSEGANYILYITENIRKMDLHEDYEGQFNEVVQQLVKEDRLLIHHHSLLHHVLRSSPTEDWASVELIRLLLKSGADINSKDYYRRTPLMYALMYAPDDRIQEILELFIEYKCHLDCKDIDGFSATEFTRWASLSFLPRSTRSLRCIAADVILESQIDYEGILSEKLKVFVRLHR